ncbi:MAG TPA: HD-GYP domain-containing protein, partial [Actinomycetota bacterium]|nr:HD-GYP domain-containing protein [Actinomycetota bacterium]
ARQVFRAYDEVSDAYVDTVRAFVSAIEAKDAYTRGHSERVAEYSLLIARKMGLKEESLEVFHFGALLHDVGKLIVRKAVLTKPSRLEEEEFDEIKRHPVVGAQIVQEIEFLRPALDAVLYHHERLDGSGYPAGLVGDIVPPWARMMAVADTYDAMTSTRAYRGARTHEEAMAELHRCSGTQFDPECISAFEEAIEELRELERDSELHEAQAVPRIAG